MRLSFRLSILPLLMICAIAHGADVWTVTTDDFNSISASLRKIDGSGLAYSSNDGASQLISLPKVLRLSHNVAATASGGAFVLHRINGDRLFGSPSGVDGDTLLWTNPIAGQIKVSLKNVRAMTRDENEPQDVSPRLNDLVRLKNQDRVEGAVIDISGRGVSVQGDGPAATVPLESIDAIYFAAVQTPATSNVPSFTVTLADRSVLTVKSVVFDGREFTIQREGEPERHLSQESIAAVEQVNGPVTWLSNLKPAEAVQIPFLGTTRPARMDRAQDGGPIQFQQQRFAHGIGVHSYSKLVWNLDGSHAAFRTQFAMAGELSKGEVVVRIKLDDRIIQERKDFGAGELSPVVMVPLDGAKTLTLEVDYGRTFDVQGRLNWIEPALLRQLPKSPEVAPSTQP